MKTCRQIAVTFLYIVLTLSLALVSYVPVAYGQTKSGAGVWWPFPEADPPELVAFSYALASYINPVPGLSIELVPEFIVEKQYGAPVKIGMAVEVTKRLPGKDIFRRYVYHGVWIGELTQVFRDTSFLRRSLVENKKLALEDVSAYQAAVEVAEKNIFPDAGKKATETCEKFLRSIGNNSREAVYAHAALDEFAARFDHAFAAYEPFLGVDVHTLEKVILVYDYKLWEENSLLVSSLVLFNADISFPFDANIVFQQKLFEASIRGVPTIGTHPPLNELARNAFRAMTDLGRNH